MHAFPAAYWPAWDSDAEFLPGVAEPIDAGGLYAALVFVFLGEHLVLADIAGRGLCIPSGRVEPGETADRAAVREVWEETGATVSRMQLIGSYRLVSRRDPVQVRWSPVFVADAVAFAPVPRRAESRGLFFVPSVNVARLYFTWDPLIEAVFHFAEESRR